MVIRQEQTLKSTSTNLFQIPIHTQTSNKVQGKAVNYWYLLIKKNTHSFRLKSLFFHSNEVARLLPFFTPPALSFSLRLSH